VIVEEGKKVGFAVPNSRPMQRISDPQFVGVGGLKPAEHPRDLAGAGSHQLAPVEMAQQGRF
jgi:hypothetical protein